MISRSLCYAHKGCLFGYLPNRSSIGAVQPSIDLGAVSGFLRILSAKELFSIATRLRVAAVVEMAMTIYCIYL